MDTNLKGCCIFNSESAPSLEKLSQHATGRGTGFSNDPAITTYLGLFKYLEILYMLCCNDNDDKTISPEETGGGGGLEG